MNDFDNWHHLYFELPRTHLCSLILKGMSLAFFNCELCKYNYLWSLLENYGIFSQKEVWKPGRGAAESTEQVY